MKLRDLLAYDSIAIQCHNIPDADALAAGFGLYRYFEAAGKRPVFFYGGPPVNKPNLTGMIESLEIPVRHAPDLKEWDGLLLTVDCQHGAGNVMQVSAGQVAVIDHHIQEKELPPLCELRPWLGSCATLIWDLLRQEGFTPDINLSTALYYGLFTDTNGFSEMRHPLDRDMWDALQINENILKRLRLSNLSVDDLFQVSTALGSITIDQDIRFALIPAPPCDPNILGVISDLCMQVNTVDLVVAYCRLASEDVKFSVRTSSRETKASELASWLAEGLGSGGGHREKAGGYIAKSKYANSVGDVPVHRYLDARIREYCCSFRILDCADPESLRVWPDMAAMKTYSKLPTRVGFVPCSSLFESRCEVQVRMLEGDMDIQVDANNTMLMIGITGEVYPVARNVFEQKYRILDEAYQPDLLYAPTVLDKVSGKRIALLQHARLCESIGSDTVKALRLDASAKVFAIWDDDDYFSGKPGDWLVARAANDLYIVTAPVFDQLYVRDFTGEDLSTQPNAQRAVKLDIPVQVAFAKEAGEVQTREGPICHEKGDAIVTGGFGESWPVPRWAFDTRYRAFEGTEPGQKGLYLPVGHPVWVMQIYEPFTVALAAERGRLRGAGGDWLVQYAPEEYGVVENAIFEKSYAIEPFQK